MAWLIEAFLNEEEESSSSSSKAKEIIDKHKEAIKDDQEYANHVIAKINKDADERIEDDPEKAGKINAIRKYKINAIKKGAELSKKKHNEAIEKIKNETKGAE